MLRRADEDVVAGKERDRLELGCEPGKGHNAEIDLMGTDGLNRLGRRGIAHDHVNPRMTGTVVLEQRRQAIARRGIGGTQYQPPALELVKVGEFLLRLLQELVELHAVTSQNLPRL